MSELYLLKNTLKPALSWHGARIEFLAKFIVALIKVSSVNLTHIAAAFEGSAAIASNYKRIQRFLKDFAVDFDLIAKLMVKIVPVGSEDWILTMDRTNWKFGKLNINILVLGVAYKGIAVPLFWDFLPKRGNSNTNERIAIFNRFLGAFGREKVSYLTADREFIGANWVEYLSKQNIKFVIRIRNNTLIPNSKGIEKNASVFFRNLKMNETRRLDRKTVWGHMLNIVGTKLPKHDHLILITNEAPADTLEIYKKRWQIETLFGCLKTRGFNFESTHLIDLERISNLLALMAISFCWAHRAGEHLDERMPIKVKNHQRKARSLFRYGLDYLRNILMNINLKFTEFINVLELLSCT